MITNNKLVSCQKKRDVRRTKRQKISQKRQQHRFCPYTHIKLYPTYEKHKKSKRDISNKLQKSEKEIK